MAIVNPTKYLTNLDEWRRLGEADIFLLKAVLNLINGEIFDITPIGFNHSGHLNRLINC